MKATLLLISYGASEGGNMVDAIFFESHVMHDPCIDVLAAAKQEAQNVTGVNHLWGRLHAVVHGDNEAAQFHTANIQAGINGLPPFKRYDDALRYIQALEYGGRYAGVSVDPLQSLYDPQRPDTFGGTVEYLRKE